MQSASNLNLENTLAARLEIAQRERTAIREACTHIDIKLKSHIAQLIERPKETEGQLQQTITELEYTHATTTQTNAEERIFMRSLEKLKLKKKAIAYFLNLQVEVDEMKAKRTILQNELREKDKTIDELYQGLRRIRTAKRLDCSTDDLVEHVLKVPEDKISKVVGKGGQTLRQVENDSRVSIDSDRASANDLRIMGTPSSISSALSAIDIIMRTVTEELNPSEETLVCLLLDKAVLMQDIQNRHNVRIDLSKAKKSCRISGFAEAVESAKSEISGLNCARTVISINSSMLPFIVGKGGATIRAIGEENHVSIDISREENKIIISGLRTGVQNATQTIVGIVEDNREVEEVLKAHKQTLIGCIIGSNGQTIRSIQTEHNVSLRSEKGVNGELDSLYIRGTSSRVAAAKQYILETLNNYSKSAEEIIVPEECMSIILGKKGSRIKVLREEHSSVNLDIEDHFIRIRGGTAAARTNAKVAIEEIVELNYIKTTPCDPEMAIVLKSSKSADLRHELVTTLSLNLDIDTDHQLVRLRGQKNAVEKGIQLISNFISESQTVFLDLDDEDCASLMNGGNPNETLATTNLIDKSSPEFHVHSPTKYVESKFLVDVYMNRKDCRLRLRGNAASVDAAKTYLTGLLNGDLSSGSQLISVDPLVYASLIGKSGSNLKKLESQLYVKFDILKSKSLLRIRGPVDRIIPAKVAVTDFMNSVRTSISTKLPPGGYPQKDLAAITSKCEAIFEVEISTPANASSSDSSISIKGTLMQADEARKYLNEVFSNKANITIKIQPNHATSIQRRFAKLFAPVRELHGVTIDLVALQNSINIQGPIVGANKAKDEVRRVLKGLFPSEFDVFPLVPPTSIRVLGSAKTIGEIQEISSAHVSVDRVSSNLTICGPSTAVTTALGELQRRLKVWEDHHKTVAIEEFMLALLVGKNGTAISALEKAAGVLINVNRGALCLEIESQDLTKLLTGLEVVQQKVDKLRLQHLEIIVDESLMGILIGKQGATINKFRDELDASVELDLATRTLVISGKEEHVIAGKAVITKFLDEERRKNYSVSMFVPAIAIPMLIGVKGASIRDIQEASGVRVEFDKYVQKGHLRGSPEGCVKAQEMIQQILDKAGLNKPASIEPVNDEPSLPEEREEESKELSLKSGIRLPPGINPELAKRSESANMSKSALRRKKRKEKTSATSYEEDNDDTPEVEDVAIDKLSASIKEATPSAILLDADVSDEASDHSEDEDTHKPLPNIVLSNPTDATPVAAAVLLPPPPTPPTIRNESPLLHDNDSAILESAFSEPIESTTLTFDTNSSSKDSSRLLDVLLGKSSSASTSSATSSSSSSSSKGFANNSSDLAASIDPRLHFPQNSNANSNSNSNLGGLNFDYVHSNHFQPQPPYNNNNNNYQTSMSPPGLAPIGLRSFSADYATSVPVSYNHQYNNPPLMNMQPMPMPMPMPLHVYPDNSNLHHNNHHIPSYSLNAFPNNDNFSISHHSLGGGGGPFNQPVASVPVPVPVPPPPGLAPRTTINQHQQQQQQQHQSHYAYQQQSHLVQPIPGPSSVFPTAGGIPSLTSTNPTVNLNTNRSAPIIQQQQSVIQQSLGPQQQQGSTNYSIQTEGNDKSLGGYYKSKTGLAVRL